MNGFREKIIRFMQGRYGGDKLGAALMIIYFVLYALFGVLRIFIKTRFIQSGISLLLFAIPVYAAFRFLSKNIFNRQKENAVFCNFLNKISPSFILLKDRIKDIRTKRYRRCPCCKNVLRLPYKRGKHGVKCPKCGKEFNVHIL